MARKTPKRSMLPKITSFDVTKAKKSKETKEEIEEQLDEQLDQIADIDTFFLVAGKFPSHHRGARSTSRVRILDIRKLYQTHGEIIRDGQTRNIELGISALNSFEIAKLDDYINLKDIPSKIEEYLLSEEEIKIIGRTQARFNNRLSSRGQCFKLGSRKFYIIDFKTYEQIKKPISRSRGLDLDIIEFKNLEKEINPMSEAEIEYLMIRIQQHVKDRVGSQFFGKATSSIIRMINFEFEDIALSKTLLEKHGTFLRKLYLTMQSTVLTKTLKKVANKHGNLDEQSIEMIDRLLKREEKLDILGNETLKEEIKELRKFLDKDNKFDALKQYINNQLKTIKKSSGLKLNV